MRLAKWLLLFSLYVAVINYPNPFNPKGGEIATFEATSSTSIEATLYIYSMSAQLIYQKPFSLPAGAINRLAWNGYNNTNELAGNGVYLYRLLETSTKQSLTRGKIWVINQ